MNHSTPGLPVHHHLPEFTRTHIHRVGDAIQPSHPLSSPLLPAPNPSQHTSGQWDDGNLWYAVALPLLRFLVIVAWDEVLVERKASNQQVS